MEDLPHPCFTGASAGDYAKKHDPFVYYTRVAGNRGRCARIVPLSRAGRRRARRARCRASSGSRPTCATTCTTARRRPATGSSPRLLPAAAARARAARPAVPDLGRGHERRRLLPPGLGRSHRHDRRRAGRPAGRPAAHARSTTTRSCRRSRTCSACRGCAARPAPCTPSLAPLLVGASARRRGGPVTTG